MSVLRIEHKGTAKELMRRIEDMPGAMRAAATAIETENDLTVSHIQRLYLSFPKTGPTQSIGCRYITGGLRRSIRASRPRRRSRRPSRRDGARHDAARARA